MPKHVSHRLIRHGRLFVILGIVLVTIYFMLPWLISSAWIRQVLISRISHQLNRNIKIQSAKFHYESGLEILGLEISDADPYEPEPLWKSERVHFSLHPYFIARPGQLLLLLLGLSDAPFQDVVIDQPQIRIVTDQNGKINLANLLHLNHLNWPAKRYELRHLKLTLIDQRPLSQSSQQLEWSSALCEIDPDSGQLRWKAISDPSPSSPWQLSGNLHVPRLKSGIVLGGTASLQWQDIDLNSIPTFLLPAPASARLNGRSTGSISLQIHDNLQVGFKVNLALTDTGVLTSDNSSWTIGNAEFNVNGSWDPHSEKITLHTLQYNQGDLLRITNANPTQDALVWDPLNEQQSFLLALQGQVQSINTLRNSIGLYDPADDKPIHTEGPLTFQVHLIQNAAMEAYRLQIQGDSVEMEIPEKLFLPKRLPKKLSVSLTRDQDDRLALEQLDLTLGQTTLTIGGHWLISPIQQNDPQFTTWFNQSQGQIELKTSDTQELKTLSPLLADIINSLQLQGQPSFKLTLERPSPHQQIEASLYLPENSSLRWRDWIEKPRGKSLNLKLGFNLLPDQPGLFEPVQLHATYGQTIVETLPQASLQLFSEQAESNPMTDSPPPLIANINLPLKISQLTDLADVFPQLTSFSSIDSTPLPTMGGDLSVHLRLNAAITKDKPVIRLQTHIEGQDAWIEIPDGFHKPPQQPADFQMDYTYDAQQEPLFQSIQLAASLNGAEGSLLLEWRADSTQDSNPFTQDLHLQLQIESLENLLAHWPTESKIFDPYQLTGGGTLHLTSHHLPQEDRWSGNIDLTPLKMVGPNSILSKNPVTPLQLDFQGYHTKPSPDQIWIVLNQLAGELGPVKLKFCSGSAQLKNIDWPDQFFNRLIQSETVSWPTLASLDLVGDIDFETTQSWQFPDSHSTKSTENNFALGQANVEFQLSYQGHQWHTSGTLQAAALEFRMADWLEKPQGIPGYLSWSGCLSVPNARNSNYLLNIQPLQLELDDAQAEITLTADYSHASTGTDLQPAFIAWQTHFDIPDLHQWSRWTQWIAPLAPQGKISGNFSLTQRNNLSELNRLQLQLQGVSVTAADRMFKLNGCLDWVNDVLLIDSLTFQTPKLQGQLFAQGPSEQKQPWTITLQLQDTTLQNLQKELHQLPQDASVVVRHLTGQTLANESIQDWVLNRPLDMDLRIRSFHWPDPRHNFNHQLDEIAGHFQRRANQWDSIFQGAYHGGLLKAHLGGSGDRHNLEFQLSGVWPTPQIQTWLRYSFPGLQPTGEIQARYFSEPEPTSAENIHTDLGLQLEMEHIETLSSVDTQMGWGELAISGGALLGKAAPSWVTTVFPDLNLARFEFTQMHDRFNVFASGRIQHEAIFEGQYYNLYAIGRESSTHSVEYEIGLDFLADLESPPAWADRSSGRIPLFVSQNQIGPAGELLSETVSYVPWRQVKAVLWDNNPIRTAYLAIKKRVQQKPESLR